MPTERFARLPAEKQESIRMAAISEFTRAPFEKVSINKIIQNADISRGSFYTYFEDKRDLLQYVFSDIMMQARQFCRESLVQNKGDYWKMLEELFDNWFQLEWSGNLVELARITMLQIGTEQLMEGCCDPEEMGGPLNWGDWLYEKGDWSKLRSQDREFIRLTTDLGMQTLVMALGQMLKLPQKREAIRQMFIKKLEIVQMGACSQEL